LVWLVVSLFSKLSRMNNFILASNSPRRKEILGKFDIDFIIETAQYEEIYTDEDPEKQVLNLSKGKIEALLKNKEELRSSIILGADTCINLDGKIIGKPNTKTEANEFLNSFSGRKHQVITGLTLYNGLTGLYVQDKSITDVTFAKLNTKEIEWYLGTGEWKEVAGGYRIQGKGSLLINSISGSWYNVVGLQIRLFYGMVATQGLTLFSI